MGLVQHEADETHVALSAAQAQEGIPPAIRCFVRAALALGRKSWVKKKEKDSEEDNRRKKTDSRGSYRSDAPKSG